MRRAVWRAVLPRPVVAGSGGRAAAMWVRLTCAHAAVFVRVCVCVCLCVGVCGADDAVVGLPLRPWLPAMRWWRSSSGEVCRRSFHDICRSPTILVAFK